MSIRRIAATHRSKFIKPSTQIIPKVTQLSEYLYHLDYSLQPKGWGRSSCARRGDDLFSIHLSTAGFFFHHFALSSANWRLGPCHIGDPLSPASVSRLHLSKIGRESCR